MGRCFPFNPAPSQGHGRVIGPVEHDPNDGIEGVGGKIFGWGQEIAGRVVQQSREVAQLAFELLDRGVDLLGIAHVGAGPGGGSARLAYGPYSFLQGFATPSQDGHPGPPSSAKRSVMTRPRPVPPPVIRMLCPFKRSL